MPSSASSCVAAAALVMLLLPSARSCSCVEAMLQQLPVLLPAFRCVIVYEVVDPRAVDDRRTLSMKYSLIEFLIGRPAAIVQMLFYH